MGGATEAERQHAVAAWDQRLIASLAGELEAGVDCGWDWDHVALPLGGPARRSSRLWLSDPASGRILEVTVQRGRITIATADSRSPRTETTAEMWSVRRYVIDADAASDSDSDSATASTARRLIQATAGWAAAHTVAGTDEHQRVVRQVAALRIHLRPGYPTGFAVAGALMAGPSWGRAASHEPITLTRPLVLMGARQRETTVADEDRELVAALLAEAADAIDGGWEMTAAGAMRAETLTWATRRRIRVELGETGDLIIESERIRSVGTLGLPEAVPGSLVRRAVAAGDGDVERLRSLLMGHRTALRTLSPSSSAAWSASTSLAVMSRPNGFALGRALERMPMRWALSGAHLGLRGHDGLAS